MEVNDKAGLGRLIERLEALQQDFREMEEGVTAAVTALQKLVDGGEALEEYVAALSEAADVSRTAEEMLARVKRVQAG